MKRIGFIPLRKGSKGIKFKNRRYVGGLPLYEWALKAANNSNLDLVYVYTDDEQIRSQVNKHYDPNRVIAIPRPASTASDEASTESAMIAFAEEIGWKSFDEIYLIQATNPLVRSQDINNCIETLERLKGINSVLTVVKQHRFLWIIDESPETLAHAVNYDPKNRPRRQELDSDGALFVENGSIYGTKSEALFESGCRVSEPIALVKMSKESYFEIDTLEDLEILEKLL